MSGKFHTLLEGVFLERPGPWPVFKLSAPLIYKDEKGIHWEVPPGTVINGATIPRFFWRLIGAPYSGQYLRASALHDWLCQCKHWPWQTAHQIFHDAMLADGVPAWKAELMYRAVRHFGPRW